MQSGTDRSMTGDADPSKRTEKRDSLFLSATVRVGDASATITRVRNLSSGGMMIDAPVEYATGTRLSAELRGIGLIHGRIAWASLGKAGVAFDEEIDPRRARSPVQSSYGMPDYLKPFPGRRPGLAVR